ncbi:MAG: HAMP domain-containing protein [Acidobacteria bacterium]|nr:HAMP domain-containing protein [Acidobacteriota bacterium]
MRQRLPDLSLGTKVVLLVVTVTGIVLASGFALVLTRDVASFRKDLVERTTLIARVVADSSGADLVFQDRKASEQTLALLRSVPDVQTAALWDSRGELFSTYRSGAEASLPERPGPQQAGAEFRNGLLLVVQPVAVPGEGAGAIAIGVSTASLSSRVRAHLVTSALVLLVLLALTVVLAFALQKSISSPLLELVATVKKLSRTHDYSVRVKPRAADEIGALCEAFNELFGEIQRRERDKERADQRSREKSLFLAHMSHELRTPLNSIIGFSDVLQDSTKDRLDAKERRFLDNVNSAGKHLLRVINNILDLSKVESGTMDLVLDTFSPAPVVEGVVEVMRGVSARRTIALVLDLPADLPSLRADEVRVKEILYNLVSNAVKFSPDGATVRIVVRAVTEPAEGVAIDVVDEGIGIDPAHHELIFQEFRQVDATEARRFEGTGLGLVLVRRFAELHGGGVRVESALGKGSRFTVFLPLRPPSRGDGKVQ